MNVSQPPFIIWMIDAIPLSRASKNCLCLNLSQREESRLLFPRIIIQQLSECADIGVEFTPNMNRFDLAQINQALNLLTLKWIWPWSNVALP